MELLCIAFMFSIGMLHRDAGGVAGLATDFLAVFGAMDKPLVSCTLVHLVEI